MDKAEAEGGWMERELQAISTDQALKCCDFHLHSQGGPIEALIKVVSTLTLVLGKRKESINATYAVFTVTMNEMVKSVTDILG